MASIESMDMRKRVAHNYEMLMLQRGLCEHRFAKEISMPKSKLRAIMQLEAPLTENSLKKITDGFGLTRSEMLEWDGVSRQILMVGDRELLPALERVWAYAQHQRLHDTARWSDTRFSLLRGSETRPYPIESAKPVPAGRQFRQWLGFRAESDVLCPLHQLYERMEHEFGIQVLRFPVEDRRFLGAVLVFQRKGLGVKDYTLVVNSDPRLTAEAQRFIATLLMVLTWSKLPRGEVAINSDSAVDSVQRGDRHPPLLESAAAIACEILAPAAGIEHLLAQKIYCNEFKEPLWDRIARHYQTSWATVMRHPVLTRTGGNDVWQLDVSKSKAAQALWDAHIGRGMAHPAMQWGSSYGSLPVDLISEHDASGWVDR